MSAMLSEFELNMLKQTVAKKLGVSVDRLKVEYVQLSYDFHSNGKSYLFDSFFVTSLSITSADVRALFTLDDLHFKLNAYDEDGNYTDVLFFSPNLLVKNIYIEEIDQFLYVSGYSFQIV